MRKIFATMIALLVFMVLQSQVYKISEVDDAPVFAKGKMTQESFLKYYLQYPQADYDKGVQGVVTIGCVVDSTGMITESEVINSVSKEIDKEALRLVSLMPFYEPAKKSGKTVGVEYQIMIPFVIKNNEVSVSNTTVSSQIVTNSNATKNPLYVVDSKVLEKDSNIDPENIRKVRIIKGQKAIDLYGNRAKDGIIMIDTK